MKKLHTIYSLLLFAFSVAFMPSAYAEEIADPNEIYRQNTFGAHRETVEDIRVKALGEDIRHTRSWNSGKWYFNRRWENLRLKLKDATSTEESNVTIYRGAAKYEYKSSGIYAHETDSSQTIIKTGDTYRWKNRQGDSIEYDANRRAINYSNRNDVTVSFQYDTQHRLTGVFDTNSNQIFWYEYNLAGQMSLVKDYSNRKVEYKYNAEGQLIEVIDVRGNSCFYTYENGRLLTKVDAEGRVTTIEYSVTGLVKGMNNAGVTVTVRTDYNKTKGEFYRSEVYSNGKVIQKWYNRNGDFLRKSMNGVSVRNIVFTNSDLVRTNTDRAGNRTTKTYDQWDNLLSTTYPDGSKTTTTYEHVFTKPVKEVNENGVITLMEYDTKGNLTKLTEASGLPEQRITTYTYNTYGNQLSRTIAADSVSVAVTISATYDNYGNQLTTTDGEGNVTEYTYDVLGNVLKRTDALNNDWIDTYDASGNRTSKTNPLGHTTSYEYDKVGNLLKVTDALGRVTRYEYDDRNNQTAVINALNQKTTRIYNSENLLIKTIDAAGKTNSIVYDTDGRPIQHVDGNGNVIQSEYLNGAVNGSGNLGKIIFPTYTEAMLYDTRGRLVEKLQQVSESIALIEKYAYDKFGNRISITDPELHQTMFTYDALNRRVTQVNPDSTSLLFNYDNRDNLLLVTNANLAVTEYIYNKNNLKVKEIKPLGQEKVYGYDIYGKEILVVDSENHKRVSIYDDAARLITVENYEVSTDADPVKVVMYTYDDVGNLTSYDDNITSGIYQYDDLNHLLSTSINFGGFVKSFSYTHDVSGNKSSFTDTEGVVNTFAYDNANQLTAVKIPSVGQVSIGNYQWTKPQSVNLPGGSTQSYNYDALLRVLELELKDTAQNSLLKYNYVYDNGNKITQRLTEHGVYQYTYDDLDRLVSVDNPLITDEAYTYDFIGNRLTESGVSGVWGYSLNNQLLTIGTETTYTYDDNGSQTKVVDTSNTRDFIYNVENRLTTVQQNAAILASYQYDPFGRRVSKQSLGKTTYYLYSEEGLIAEIDQSGSVLKQYGWKPNTTWGTDPVYLKENTNIYFYQNDHLGTPQKLINLSGFIVWAAMYDGFGEATVIKQDVVNNLRLAGQYYDQETGNYYNYFRDYNPVIGRYIESDPIGLLDGVNEYTYSRNNALFYIDPYGLYCLTNTEINIIAGALGGAAGGAISDGFRGAKTGNIPTIVLTAVFGAIRGGAAGAAASAFGTGGGVIAGATLSGSSGVAKGAFGGAVGEAIAGVLGNGIVGNAVGGAIGARAAGGNRVAGAIGGAVAAAANSFLNAHNDCDDDC